MVLTQPQPNVQNQGKWWKGVKAKAAFLIVIHLFFGVLGAIVPSPLSTFLGALTVAVGSVIAVIHRMMVENKQEPKDEAVNTPLALIGIGGMLLAGGALPALAPSLY